MYFVFDVEAMGLYGLGFAVGYVVIDEEGKTLAEGYIACPHNEAYHSGTCEEDVAWMEHNVFPNLPEPNCEDLPALYDVFWEVWLEWRDQGAKMVADVTYPVESNFLRACVLHSPRRKWEAPFPLLDIGTLEFFVGVERPERLESELPEHNPLNDSRHSARFLMMLVDS